MAHILEKLPFLLLGAVSCLITFLVQKRGGAVFRFVCALPGQLFWPADLALPYPLSRGMAAAGLVAFAVALTLGLCAAAWWFGRQWPFLRTGWFWFFGTLIPVIGLVQVGTISSTRPHAWTR